MGVRSYDDNDIFSRYLDLNAPNVAMQKSPPAIPADLLALSTPKYNGAWVFTDSKQPKTVCHAAQHLPSPHRPGSSGQR